MHDGSLTSLTSPFVVFACNQTREHHHERGEISELVDEKLIVYSHLISGGLSSVSFARFEKSREQVVGTRAEMSTVGKKCSLLARCNFKFSYVCPHQVPLLSNSTCDREGRKSERERGEIVRYENLSTRDIKQLWSGKEGKRVRRWAGSRSGTRRGRGGRMIDLQNTRARDLRPRRARTTVDSDRRRARPD